MPLLDKLFSTKRKLDDGCRESRDRKRSFKVTPEQVRLLLYKECDWRGRKLLFDSSTIQKVPAGKNDQPATKNPKETPYIVEVSNGFSYLYKGPAVDAATLGDMIFGAVAINYKGVSLKIHIMDEPRRLLCTKLFCVPSSPRRLSRGRQQAPDDEGTPVAGSKPLSAATEDVSLSLSFDRGDSGFCGEHSIHSSVSSSCDFISMFDNWDPNNTQEDFYTFHSPPGRRLSTSSAGSWQRRTFRSVSTKFELGSQSANLLTVPSNLTSNDSQIYSNSSTSGTSDSLTSGSGSVAIPRRNKLGLALLITVPENDEMDLVRTCVEHSPQLQALVCRLRLATIAAGGSQGFVATLYTATADAATWLTDLVYGPRVSPMWLDVVTSSRDRHAKLAESLLADLCAVLAAADTKHTNFFISTLLTHVLTHHLGWVTTVSPYDVLDPQRGSDGTHPPRPYNALWAQLGDLCGTIGYPPRAAKTIICGSHAIVNRLLVVLTYFMRCGEVKRRDFQFKNSVPKQTRVISVPETKASGLKRNPTRVDRLIDVDKSDSLQVPIVVTQSSDSSVTLVSDKGVRRTATVADLSSAGELDKPMTSQLKRIPTLAVSLNSTSSSSLNSSEEPEVEQKVVFVLGEDEKLVGLKNKSVGGKSVKKSSKVSNEPQNPSEREDDATKDKENCDVKFSRSSESPSKCCGQTLQHSKPIKHSGFKFEFDKYPQIVTNYMKSKNLEILDRHYIGKPGNLKLDNFQFDPTIVPPIQEERCETCYRCQLMESTLQTPTNASELEFMNDMPRQSEPQFARESIETEKDSIPVASPKNFIRRQKENTVLVNVVGCPDDMVKAELTFPLRDEKQRAKVGESEATQVKRVIDFPVCPLDGGTSAGMHEFDDIVTAELTFPLRDESKEKERARVGQNVATQVKRVIEFPVCPLDGGAGAGARAGFDASLLGGVTDHYVPDMVLQGTVAPPSAWEGELRRDLDLTSYLNKTLDTPVQAVAIVGDTNTWEVMVVGRETAGGGGGAGTMSGLVGAMLDALPHMRRANVPAIQCLSFLESKLREFCVLSKTLADILMSTDFCDMSTLTKSMNIDINDVPLLLAVATTHTPQVARRYGISYR